MKKFGMMKRILSLFLGAMSFGSQGAYADKKRNDAGTKLTKTESSRRNNKGNRNKDDVIKAIKDAKKKGHNIKLKKLRNGKLKVTIGCKVYVVSGLMVLAVLGLFGAYWKYHKSEGDKEEQNPESQKKQESGKDDKEEENKTKLENEVELNKEEKQKEESKLKQKQEKLMHGLSLYSDVARFSKYVKEFGESEEERKNKISNMNNKELSKNCRLFDKAYSLNRYMGYVEEFGNSLYMDESFKVENLVKCNSTTFDKKISKLRSEYFRVIDFNEYLLKIPLKYDAKSMDKTCVKEFFEFLGDGDVIANFNTFWGMMGYYRKFNPNPLGFGEMFGEMFGDDFVKFLGTGEAEKEVSFWSILFSGKNMTKVKINVDDCKERSKEGKVCKLGDFKLVCCKSGLAVVNSCSDLDILPYDKLGGEREFFPSTLALTAVYMTLSEETRKLSKNKRAEAIANILQDFQDWLEIRRNQLVSAFNETQSKAKAK